jgi:hypothetical protein
MAARTVNRSAKRGSARRPGRSAGIKAGKKATGGKALRPVRASDKSKAPAKKAPAKTTRRPAEGSTPGKPSTQYIQNKGWDVIDVADGIAVYDDKFGTVHYLNHTAAVVFLLCKQPVGLDVLCTVFQEEFGLKTAPKAELRKIIAEMQKTGLLRLAGLADVTAARARPTRKR